MTKSLLRNAGAFLALAALAACSDKGGDPKRQYGPNPYLPDPHQYLLPPMSVPEAMGWAAGQVPSVPAGLQIQAMATGLAHPRMVYALPNGDVLVAESNSPGTEPFRPKDYITGKVKNRAGAGAQGGNRITLLRDADGDGKPELRSVFIDHLKSPFGIALVGDALYVADTDAILQFRYPPGATRITDAPVQLTDLPAGPINHHWTKALTASPDGSKLYVGVGSNSNITENGMDAEDRPGRDLRGRPADRRQASISRRARATRPASRLSRRPANCSPSSTSGTRSGPISSPTI